MARHHKLFIYADSIIKVSAGVRSSCFVLYIELNRVFNLTLILFPPLLTVSGDCRILPAFILLQTASGKLPHYYSAAGVSTG